MTSPNDRMFMAAAVTGEEIIANAIRECAREPKRALTILMSVWTRGIEVGVRLGDLHPEVVRDFLGDLDDTYPDEIRELRDKIVETIATAGRTT